MPKDNRKRLTVALNFDDATRTALEKIAEEESRSVTQQIEYFLKEAVRYFEETRNEMSGVRNFARILKKHPGISEEEALKIYQMEKDRLKPFSKRTRPAG